MLRFVAYDAANQPTGRYQREFTIKDHLGNLRLAYRAGQVRTYTATLEQDAATHRRESQRFDSFNVSPPVAFATPQTRSGNWVARLKAGGNSPQPLGPLTRPRVQKGDTVTWGERLRPLPAASASDFWFSPAAFVTNLLQPAPALDAQLRITFPVAGKLERGPLASISQLAGGVLLSYLRVLVFGKDSVLASRQL